jgi:hypothetical protein
VNVTGLFRPAGLSELAIVVVVAEADDEFTTCDTMPLLDPLFVKSPA